MAKEAKKKDQATIEAENEERTRKTLESMAGVGEVDEELSAQSEEADAFASMPTVTPGKPGFEDGKTLAGFFVRTKAVENENSSAAKVNPATGKRERMLHIFRDRKGTQFGIWGVGPLDAAMRCLRRDDYIEVTNVGLAAAPLKPGHNPPREFRYKGRRADGSKLTFDWDSEEDAVPTQPAATVAPQARQ